MIKGFGTPDLLAETLLAFEAGYRIRATERLFLDVAGFYNVYDDLRSAEGTGVAFELDEVPPHVVIFGMLGSKLHGNTAGVELAVDWQVPGRWRARSSYSYLRMRLEPDADSDDLEIDAAFEGVNPVHQFFHRSSFDLGRAVFLDVGLRAISRLPSTRVAAYWGLDLRMAWQPVPRLELFVSGKNLLQHHHIEYKADFGNQLPSQVQRSVHGGFGWTF